MFLSKLGWEEMSEGQQAITQQGGREYVNLKWVEKWNGNLPQTMLGNAVPLVNINQ